MQLAGPRVRTVAIDLPGIGGSGGEATNGSKRQLAGVVHALIEKMGLGVVTLVGQDVGGMIAYSYLKPYDDVGRAVIMDVAGISRLEHALVPGAGHFTQEEAPVETWRLIAGFIGP